ncbi:MAG: acyl-CoA dehydrogenase [Candidatus Tectimicrobiota bacterium]|nr:MAG: acyl-CoA dehydrogenase [Candidatus Tectomicrobia bacterium]
MRRQPIATAPFPATLVRQAGALGLLGILTPPEYGGTRMGYLALALVVEALAAACASTALVIDVHVSTVIDPLQRFGLPEQKARWLPAMSRGERLGAFVLSEPEAGSDAAAIRTRAVRDGDTYVLDGHKTFITNAGQADVYVVFAKTAPQAGSRGITAFLVERDTPGMTFGAPMAKMGLNGSATADVHFDRCRVPLAHRLGEEGQGFKIAMITLDYGRIGIAAQAVGLAQGAFDYAFAYARQRQAFGQPIVQFQGLQFLLADLITRIEAARYLTYKAAHVADQGDARLSRYAAMAKLFASETAMHVTTEAVQVLGGHGYMKAHPVERMMRDAKASQLYEGTSQIQRLVIARRLLAEHAAR